MGGGREFTDEGGTSLGVVLSCRGLYVPANSLAYGGTRACFRSRFHPGQVHNFLRILYACAQWRNETQAGRNSGLN